MNPRQKKAQDSFSSNDFIMTKVAYLSRLTQGIGSLHRDLPVLIIDEDEGQFASFEPGDAARQPQQPHRKGIPRKQAQPSIDNKRSSIESCLSIRPKQTHHDNRVYLLCGLRLLARIVLRRSVILLPILGISIVEAVLLS